MSRLSRTKGRRFELAVAKALQPVFPNARPNLAQTRGAKREGGDLVGVPFHVECFHGKANKLAAKWRQACRDAGMEAGIRPVVIAKRDRQPPVVLTWAKAEGVAFAPVGTLVMFSLEDWLAILAARERAVVSS